jgi:hypothetical protein
VWEGYDFHPNKREQFSFLRKEINQYVFNCAKKQIESESLNISIFGTIRFHLRYPTRRERERRKIEGL